VLVGVGVGVGAGQDGGTQGGVLADVAGSCWAGAFGAVAAVRASGRADC